MNDVRRVAELIQERNRVDAALSACIGRPALTGHLGDWIAAQVFGIELEKGARGVDGRLADGRTVNVRWNLRRESLLDLKEDGPDLHLVLTGPKASAVSSKGTASPMVIDAVYLFDAAAVVGELRARGRKIGVASSVREELWEAAEIYPR
ncbi:hypothetical protein, partial [Lentzea sp.]|uniref:hypothetical protein n=1 Tax=Lentzea sp. TaxID=56099 RepID=UPI002BFFDB63